MKKALALLLSGIVAAAALPVSASFIQEEAYYEVAFSVNKAATAWTPDGVYTPGEYFDIAVDDAWRSSACADDANDQTAWGLDYKLALSWDNDYFYTYIQYVDPNGHDNTWGADPASMWYSGAIQINHADEDQMGDQRLEYGVGLTSDSGQLISNVWADYLASGFSPKANEDYIVTVDGDTVTYEARTPFSAFTTLTPAEGAIVSCCYVLSWGNGQDYCHTQLAEGCTGNGKDAGAFAMVTLAGVGEVKAEASAPAASTAAPAAAGEIVTSGLVANFEGSYGKANGEPDVWKDSVKGYELEAALDDNNYWTDNAFHVDSAYNYFPDEILDLVNGEKFTVEIALGELECPGTSYISFIISDNDNFSLFNRVDGDYIEFKAAGNARPKVPGGADYANNSTLTVTFDLDSDVVMYVDGVEIGRAMTTETIGADSLFLGHYDAARNWIGNVYGIRFYDRALTADEVAQNAAYDNANFRGGAASAPAAEAPAAEAPAAAGEVIAIDAASAYQDYPSMDVLANSGAGYATLEEAAAAIGKAPINAYTFISGTGSFANEGPENLWDNDTTTKFCSGEFPTISIAAADGEYAIDGIIMATANDNSGNNNRSPYEWCVYGSNDGANWTALAYGDDYFFEEVDFTYYAAPVTTEGSYKYFMFQSEGGLSGCFQVSELVLCGTKVASAEPAVEETPAEEPVVEETPVEEPVVEEPAAITIEENLFTGATVVEISGLETEGSNLGEAAIDGDITTRWASNCDDAAYIVVDLGKTVAMDSIDIYWETACAADYTVEVSTDNENWTVVATVTDNAAGTSPAAAECMVSSEWAAVNARYVKINCTRRNTAWGNSIWEMVAFESDAVVEEVVEAPAEEAPVEEVTEAAQTFDFGVIAAAAALISAAGYAISKKR